jgi:hypothetical protein
MTCCNHNCNQGRDCPLRSLPHRLDALHMDRLQGFLHTEDGGRRVHGPDSVHVRPTKPAAAPTESATERSDTLGWIALVLAAAAALAVVLSQLPF